MRTNTMLWTGLAVLALACVASASPVKASEFSCNQDPIYERSFNAKPTIALRLRSIPCMDESEVLTVMPQGTVVPVIAEMDGWYKVKFNGLVGWAGSQLMQKTDETAPTSAIKTVTTGQTAVKAIAIKKVGISEYNFTRLQAGNAWLKKYLKGTIVLRVQKRGEAYYVNPNGTLRYLKNLDEVNQLLGVSTTPKISLTAKSEGGVARLSWAAANVGAIDGYKIVVSDEANPTYPEDDYQYVADPKAASYAWSGFDAGDTLHFRVCSYAGGACKLYSNDLALTIVGQTATETKPDQPVVTSGGSMVLTAVLSDPGKVKLNWTVNGTDVSKGFKVVVSESANPVYPGNDYHYLSDPSVRQDYWSGLGNKVYHFRVCQYLGGACGTYSNDVAIQVSTNGAVSQGAMPGSITLNATAAGNGSVSLTWGVSEVDVSKGFKVVVSDKANPVYPGNDYHYLSDSGARSDVWKGLAAGSVYHFRVCQYLGGYCGTYSNDVPVTVQ